jgi:hypothetical protein
VYHIADIPINSHSFINVRQSAVADTNKHKILRILTMLKIVNIPILIVIFSLVVTCNPQADTNNALQNIYTIVKVDDKGEPRKKMKRVQSDYNFKLKDYYTGVSCGGKSLIRTSALANRI